MTQHTETAGLSPRRTNLMSFPVPPSEADHGTCRPNNGDDEAGSEGPNHHVAEWLQFHACEPISRSAAVSASGLAILLHREVLLVGITLGSRTHRAGRRVTVEASIVTVERPRRLDLVVREPGVAAGPIVGHCRRDRGNANNKGGGDGGDTGLHGCIQTPVQDNPWIWAVSFCLRLRWGADFILDVTPRTRRRGLKYLEAQS